MQETWVRSLGLKDLLQKETATRSTVLAWRILWTEEPGGLQSMASVDPWTLQARLESDMTEAT